jgi:predicted HTH transcriptional regulator
MNPAIEDDSTLIEAWGSGIQKMHDELGDYPEIELSLHEASHSFQAQFIKKEAARAGSGPSEAESGAGSGKT